MVSAIYRFKYALSRVFDDNLETTQWKNVLDYTIIGLILLSTAEVFLSTFEGIAERYSAILNAIDLFTIAFFTVEVTLRIWCADLLDDRYKGFRGRVRYCLSFFGLIDILSTYTYYLTWFVPLNYAVFKSLRLVRVLRVFRLLRIFRFLKSIRLMGKAMQKCKTEMLISIQFLCIITLILSFILFFVEHEVQPDVYDNGWMSVAWAFAQYVGDPGGFADTPPMTTLGQVIAFLVGVLGVAIFAIPAGLIGGAFSDVMADEQHEEDVNTWCQKLHMAFVRLLDRPTGYYIAPRYLSVMEIQARIGLKEDEIMEAAQRNDHFRIINLSCTEPTDRHPYDRLAVEHFPLNTIYGNKIDRGSRITIFTPSNIVDPVMGWWGYYLAKIGGFNYISRELGVTRPYRSFYTYDANNLHEHQQVFMDDLNSMLTTSDSWVFTILAASGQNEQEWPTQFHFEYGGKKGDQTYEDPHITLNDPVRFESFYQTFSHLLEEKYKLYSDKQLYHDTSKANIFARHLDKQVNAIYLRVAWSVTCWDMRAIQIAQDMATVMNQQLDAGHSQSPSSELSVKDIAYDGYQL